MKQRQAVEDVLNGSISWNQLDHVDNQVSISFFLRQGFVRLALQHGVPSALALIAPKSYASLRTSLLSFQPA